jgi:hypothetical protein
MFIEAKGRNLFKRNLAQEVQLILLKKVQCYGSQKWAHSYKRFFLYHFPTQCKDLCSQSHVRKKDIVLFSAIKVIHAEG